MFENETHNHPTEIEPFGGAATCLGEGAIRDPLSGRVYVYQAMRVTGSADPRNECRRYSGGETATEKDHYGGVLRIQLLRESDRDRHRQSGRGL